MTVKEIGAARRKLGGLPTDAIHLGQPDARFESIDRFTTSERDSVPRWCFDEGC
jgi:hypothetical protein